MFGNITCDLRWTRQSYEYCAGERLHRSVASHRKANAKAKGDPVDPRPLVCARNRRHRQYGAKNHSRFRRFSSRALPGAIILRPAVRISLAACNKCWRPYRSLLTTHGDSITGQGLCHAYPDADIPVAQLSIDET
jgi:hypothetical protein